MLISSRQDGVFTEEARKPGETRDRQACHAQGHERDWHCFSESAHVTKILLSAQAMDHTARAQEEQRFEEGMCHHVEDTGRVCTQSHAKEHVTKLGDGRVSEDFLDIV